MSIHLSLDCVYVHLLTQHIFLCFGREDSIDQIILKQDQWQWGQRSRRSKSIWKDTHPGQRPEG
jgi:hypothetical protein